MSRKPKGYWTKEKCHEEALKYNSKMDFRNLNRSCYSLSQERGWLNDICVHMININKPKGYWTKEKCHEEALKYNSKKDFKFNSRMAHIKSMKNKWMNDICSHMVLKKPKGYWTKEKCCEISSRCKTKTEFQYKYGVVYRITRKNGWLDDFCSHMEINGNRHKKCIYCYEFPDNFVYVGLTYNLEKRQNIRNFDKNDQVTKHINETNLQPIRKQLTDYIDVNESVKLEEFYVNKYKIEGWNILNKSKTGGIGGNIIKWTYEKCKEESLKYSSRTEFAKKCGSAYSSSLKNNWLNEICLHMKPSHLKNKNNNGN